MAEAWRNGGSGRGAWTLAIEDVSVRLTRSAATNKEEEARGNDSKILASIPTVLTTMARRRNA
jgi:hypothetical protein